MERLDYKIEIYKDSCDKNQCPVERQIKRLMLALKEPALSKFRAHRHDYGKTSDGMIEHLKD